MALGEPATNEQLGILTGLVQEVVPHFATIDEFSRLIEPIYQSDFWSLNQGQARMLIDDLRHERDGLENDLGYPSIFARRRKDDDDLRPE